MIHSTCIRENNTSNDDILLDDRHISYSQLSTATKEAQTGYDHLIDDCLWHREMVLPLLADTPTFPQTGRFQLPTNTGTEIRKILCVQQNIKFRALRKLLYAIFYKWLMYNIQTKTHVTYPTTAIHKTPYLLQTYKVCSPILTLRLFSDTFRAEQEGQLQSLLHLPQRGREELLKVVVVTVRWLWWPCTGTRAASTCVFLNCEYSQYVSVGSYLNKIRGLRGVWWTQTKSSGTYVTLPVHSHPTSTETLWKIV